MVKGKIITALLGLFITIPIWFFLLYSILSALDVDRLVWFLFWIYLPSIIIIHIVGAIIEYREEH